MLKVMPSSLLQSDGGAFIHMIMVGTFTKVNAVLFYCALNLSDQMQISFKNCPECLCIIRTL